MMPSELYRDLARLGENLDRLAPPIQVHEVTKRLDAARPSEHVNRFLATPLQPHEPSSDRSVRRRRLAIITGLVVAVTAATAGGVYITRHHARPVRVIDEPSTLPSATSAPTQPQVAAPVGVGPRPVITLDGCTPIAANEVTTKQIFGFAYPGNGAPVAPGAQVVQVYGDTARRLAGPFVVVERSAPSSDQGLPLAPTTTIDGRFAAVSPITDTKGGADWRLADGSYVIVRSRGLTATQLLGFVGALVPKRADNGAPGRAVGFTLSTPAWAELAASDRPSTAHFASSSCQLGGEQLEVQAVQGDLIAQASLWEPQPSSAVAKGDGSTDTLTFVRGKPGTDGHAAVALASVKDASPEEWTKLLNKKPPDASSTPPTPAPTTPGATPP